MSVNASEVVPRYVVQRDDLGGWVVYDRALLMAVAGSDRRGWCKKMAKQMNARPRLDS